MENKIKDEKEICQYIIETLLWNIVEQPSLTMDYGDLSERISKLISAPNLSARLELIYHLCTKYGCPPLPVMVLNQKNHRPSPWFYRHYEVIHQLHSIDERAIFRKELDDVYYYPEWEKFAKQLNLSDQLTIRLEKRSNQLKEYLRKKSINAKQMTY